LKISGKEEEKKTKPKRELNGEIKGETWVKGHKRRGSGRNEKEGIREKP